LNYFDPEPVTPNADYQEDTGTISEHFGVGGGVLTSTFAGTRVATNVTRQAQGEMILSPVGNSGGYFDPQSREATRFQWIGTWRPANLNLLDNTSCKSEQCLPMLKMRGKSWIAT
jgi:hypothetical protein